MFGGQKLKEEAFSREKQGREQVEKERQQNRALRQQVHHPTRMQTNVCVLLLQMLDMERSLRENTETSAEALRLKDEIKVREFATSSNPV